MDPGIIELFTQVERYVMPLVGSNSPYGLTKEENRILALQNINRLNQRIGQLSRGSGEATLDMSSLQTFVNNLTVGVKYDNPQQMRSALTSIRNVVGTTKSTKSKKQEK